MHLFLCAITSMAFGGLIAVIHSEVTASAVPAIPATPVSTVTVTAAELPTTDAGWVAYKAQEQRRLAIAQQASDALQIANGDSGFTACYRLKNFRSYPPVRSEQPLVSPKTDQEWIAYKAQEDARLNALQAATTLHQQLQRMCDAQRRP